MVTKKKVAAKKKTVQKAATKATRMIIVPATKRKRAIITVQGLPDSELIMHRWDEKGKAMMRAKQFGYTAKAKKAKNPGAEFLRSMYVLGDDPKMPPPPQEGRDIMGPAVKIARSYTGGYGFPVLGFKAAMVRAGKMLGLVMADLQVAFLVIPDCLVDGIPLVQLHPMRGKTFKDIRMREDMVKLQGKTADLRYRGAFPTWIAGIHVEYDEADINAENLANLAMHAGEKVGVGEWRPERKGIFGRFEVAGFKEIA